MRRRRFLQALLGGLGWGWAGLPAWARPPHVVVVGAGPAGLSAALSLVEAGVFVTLLEAAGQVGGKAKGWTADVGGVTVDVETGVHQFDSSYIHFRDLLQRYALEGALREASRRSVRLRDQGRVSLEALNEALQRRARQSGLGWATLRREARRLAQLGATEIRHRYRGRAGDGLPPTPLGLIGEAFARLWFWEAPGAIDAESLLRAGRRAVLPAQWIGGNPQALLWEPLARAFKSQRGKLRLHHRVDGLVVEGGRVVGVTVGEPLREWRLPEPRSASWTAIPGDEPLFVRRRRGVVEALHGRCTHAGCAVAWEEGLFVCPCHGGRYDAEGRNIAGPPPSPLPRARVEREGGQIRIRLGGTLETVRADAVLLAVDARSFARIAGPWLPGFRGLETVEHAVARFWFDGPVPADLPDAELVEGDTHVTAAVWVSQIQDAARAWARRTGGAVLEVRIGKPLPPAMSNRAVLDLVESELRLLFPALVERAVVERTLARGWEFTRYEPGWRGRTTGVRTALPGLFVAGDHVRDGEGQLLERAVATGRVAASAVLESLGGAPLPPVTKR